MNYIGHFIWFIKESYSFMAPRNKIWITFNSLVKAHHFAKEMCVWNKLTLEQRVDWYESGEGRTIEL